MRLMSIDLLMLLNLWRVVAGKVVALVPLAVFFPMVVSHNFTSGPGVRILCLCMHSHTVEIWFYLWDWFKAAELLVCLQLWRGICYFAIYINAPE